MESDSTSSAGAGDDDGAREASLVGTEAEGPELRVAIVGTGMIADAHLAALPKVPGAGLATLVDLDAQRAQAASRQHGGAPWTTSLDEALTMADAVILCTPNATHAPLARTCLEAGRHVLVEKPFALRLGDAQDMRRIASERGLIVSAAHTHRAYDYSRAVREAICAGDVGDPQLLRLAFLGGWQWGDWRSWVLDPARSGGHVFHNGVHLLDTVTWWMGKRPVQVSARGARLTSSHLAIDDHLEMTVVYEDGSLALTEMSRGHRPARAASRDVLVVGREGVLSMPDGSDMSAVVDESGATSVTALASDAFARQLDAFLRACRGDGTPLASSEDGVLSVAMAEAAQRSIETERPQEVAA